MSDRGPALRAPPETALIRRISGDRLHLVDGPIEVVLRAYGDPDAVEQAHAAAAERFGSILRELVAELPLLRAAVTPFSPAPGSAVGRRMHRACLPFADRFVTAMAAVAGSVADELISVMWDAAPLRRAFVNDGGDIAVRMAPGEALDVAIAGGFGPGPVPAINGAIRIGSGDGVGGIATSGARGRSFSLGIADSVTVLAADAATADVAATLIGNAVDLDHPGIRRRPAVSLDPDSDLGDRPVTVSVPDLGEDAVDKALDEGRVRALEYIRRGLVAGVALTLQGRTVAAGTWSSAPQRPGSIGERKAS